MQSPFSPDRVFAKSESISMKRAPLAVISYAENKPMHTSTESSGILCKRIDNSAHFVDLNSQAQPTKKFTPMSIPLEAMKKKPLASTVPNRVLMTEPNDYNLSSAVLDTQHLHTESSESYRNLNKKRIQKHYTSVSINKSQPKKTPKESAEKKEREIKMTGVKRKIPTSKDSLRSSMPLDKKNLENIKAIKSRSPKNIMNRNIQIENVPVQTVGVKKSTEKRSKPRLVKKEKAQPQVSQVKRSMDIKSSTKQSLAASLRHPIATEQTTEKSPPRENTELDRFVRYNAMRILWEIKEQKKQEEFDRRLNEERKAALDEGNKRIREANFLRFNFHHKLNPKQRLAWGADQRKFTRQVRSPSEKKALKPKIDDEERRKVLGLDHVDEAKLERFREKVRMTLNQDSFEELQEQEKPKKHMTEEEYEDLHRYMIEKKIRMEEEWRHKKQAEYLDFERKRKNLERLFTEIRESRPQVPKPSKKKGKKRTKKRRTEKLEEGSRAQQIVTEPTDMRLGTQESDDENYSLLYDEYKKIIKSKTTPKGEAGQHKGSSHGKQVLTTIQPNLYEQDEFEQKKKEYKKKYDEISNRYQKNLANNMQMQENKLNSRQLKQGLEYQEEQEEEYSDQQNLQDSLPANSAREIIEAAAIFIQKNYRGYRTRKILREYISQLYREYQEELEAEGEGGEYYDEDEEEREEEEEEDIDEEQRAHHHMQEHQQGRHHYEAEEEEEDQGLEEEEGLEQEEEEYEKEENREEGEQEEEEGEQVDIEDEDNYEFLGDDEKQSLRSLLEKQKLGLHEEYNNNYDENEQEGDEEAESSEQAGPGGNFVERYRQIKDQYQVLYDQEDLRGGVEEGEDVRNESDLDVDQDIIDINEEGAPQRVDEERELEKEGSEYFTAPPPRMAKSDGEIIENYQFDLDEEESQVIINDGHEYVEDELEGTSEDGDNQISLHGDGEDDYQAVIKDKNMRFNFEHGGKEERGSVKQQHMEQQDQQDSQEEYAEENQEYQEGEYEEEGDDQEGYDPRYDPQFQKGYLQGYEGNFRTGKGDLGEYEQEGEEEEEGYIHESDYEGGFDQEEQQYEQEQYIKQQQKRRHSEGELRHREQGESEELQEEEEDQHDVYNETPEDEYEMDHEEEEEDHEEGFLNQQRGRNGDGAGDNEKIMVVSTINSEDDLDAGMHVHEQNSRRHPQRRNKSDVNTANLENESPNQTHSRKESAEERKSYTLSTHSKREQASKSRGQEELQGRAEEEEEHHDEHDEEELEENEELVDVDDVEIEEDIPESGGIGDYGANSDHFREELIEELKQNQSNNRAERYRYAEQQEDELHEEEAGENEEDFFRRTGSLKEPGPQEEEEKVKENERGSEKSRHLTQKSGDFNEQFQAELNKIREEQANKWDQMVESLSLLTSQGEVQFNQNIKAFIETLQKQSEINKIALTSDIEEVNIPEGEPNSANRIDLGDPNSAYGLSDRMGFQGAQGTRTLDITKIPPALKKKLDVISPRQESKYLKKIKPFGLPKKNNLHIDVHAANEDSHETESAGLNLDLSQMRLVLGSEQLLREQSARTLSHSASAPSDGDSVDFHAFENAEGMSIFERDPFKEFTRRKFKELMEQENMKNLIKMREQALEIRHKTQLDEMKKALENRRVSPRTFQHKQIELEKWITREREIIQKTKKDIERGWLSTADSIQRTQRDLQFLQKALAGAEGRNTNTSEEISLRHSFTDEETGENAETQSERLSKRSLFNIANELRSPSPSKNIKIIDKFELKDHLFSPQLNNSMGSKKDHVEELKAEFEGRESEEKPRNAVEASGSPLNFREEDLSKRHLLESKDSQPSTGRKAVDYQMDSVRALSQGEYSHTQEEDNLQALTSEEMRSSEKPQNRPAKVQVHHEKKELLRKDSPLENDNEVNPDELIDEEIEWENEVVQSPRIFEEANDNREYTPGRSAFSASARRDLVSPMHLGDHSASLSASYSPKSQEDLRYMFQEKIKQMQVYQNDYVVEGEVEEGEREIEGEEQHQQHHHHVEELDPENIQAKTDLICGEIIEELFEELGEELLCPGKERILDKIPLLGEEPPVHQANLHNLIENNYFFHAGAEHPNFQANIAMPHLMSPEHYKHQHEKMVSPVKEPELTPEQQRQMHFAEMQTEMLRTLGIRTEMPYINRYLEMLVQEIVGPYKESFLRNMNTPLGFSPFEKLTNMRNYGLGATDSSSIAASSSESQLVLETHVYFALEGRIMEEFPERNEVSTELEHIHNKMIFDCCNDILNFFRPFGLNGVPYPWKAGSKALKTQKVTEENMIEVLGKMQTKVIDWASYLCGYFGENDEFIHDKSQSFTDEYLAQVREERILRMLSEEIFEMENKWITYDEEEAEVELEISDLVFDHMVTETAELIAQIYEQRRGQSPNWMSQS